MSREHDQPPILDERTQRAVDDLKATIRRSYPDAVFELTPGPEDPRSLHLVAIVDLDDPDEVGDLVLEQILDLNVEQGIPLHVIPVRTPERVAAEKAQLMVSRRHARPLLSKSGLLRH